VSTPTSSDTLAADQERVLTALLAMQRQSWEQGVAGHAMLDLGRLDLVRVMAHDAVTRQTSTGKLAEIDDVGAVNCGANGEAVHWVAEADRDPELAEAFSRQLHWLEVTCPRAADGTLFHLEGGREVWSDSVYMIVPMLVLAGNVQEAGRQLAGHRRRLFDPDTGLYAARWDEDAARLNAPQFWGTGSGWVTAAIARSLHLLRSQVPPSTAGTAFAEEAAAHARTVLDGCLAHRRDDGLFHDVVDDPTTFVETNLAQMLAYTALTGVADGWLDDSYVEIGRSLLEAARRTIDARGFVTGACGAPRFDRPGTSAEAQSFFLLASRAAQRLDGEEGS
jgi:unsaturated rhamnogalacturonyl hydrolase